MEKKYPGNYKRSHLVRPIVRPNAVEKFIKKKGSISHKTGMPPAKRSELSLYKRWGEMACVDRVYLTLVPFIVPWRVCLYCFRSSVCILLLLLTHHTLTFNL